MTIKNFADPDPSVPDDAVAVAQINGLIDSRSAYFPALELCVEATVIRRAGTKIAAAERRSNKPGGRKPAGEFGWCLRKAPQGLMVKAISISGGCRPMALSRGTNHRLAGMC